jgi:broad specificity phosphatase PhoE
VILVRHSTPAIDPTIESARWGLSEIGRIRARALADRIALLAPDAIYSSPENKARETAEIVGAAVRLRVTVVADLREHDRTGVPFLREPGQFESQLNRLFAEPSRCVFGTESAEAALSRFRNGVRDVTARGDQRPMLVTHGTVMSLYIGAEAGLDPEAIWAELTTPCYVVLDPASGLFSGVSHL